MPAAVTLTLAEAAAVLDPPMSEQQLRQIVRALRWQPHGHRYTGRAGRPAPAYDATRLMELHGALVPFLAPAAAPSGIELLFGHATHLRKRGSRHGW